MVMIGSMLPDIIDKPLGIYIMGSTFDDGRIFAHTLLFTIILSLISIYFFKTKRYPWFKFLAIGSACHLVLDQMWQTPRTLFWPLYGFSFGNRIGGGSYVTSIIKSNIDNSYTYETEAIGLIILALFAIYYKLYEPARLKAFILDGKLGRPIDLSFFIGYAINRFTHK